MKTQAEIKSLKEGKYVIIDDEPCKVVRISTSRPGKHGHAKIRIEAVGIIDRRKREIVKPGDAKVEVPIVEKKKAQVISVGSNSVHLMDLQDYQTFEISKPEERQLVEGEEVVYWEVMGKRFLK
jgi:translation initiation factor 5A